MNRKFVLFAMVVTILMSVHLAIAQQSGNIPLIAFIMAGSARVDRRVEAFRQGLRDLGYLEGQNIIVEHRYWEARGEKLHDLAAEIARLKPDVIVATSNTTISFVRKATKTIPIVMANSVDPVERGFVASLARPGGNITGLSSLGAELSGKVLELLKETLPRVNRVAVLGDATNLQGQEMKGLKAAAEIMAVRLQPVAVRDARDFEKALSVVAKQRLDALYVLRASVTRVHYAMIGDLAVKYRLPAFAQSSELALAGGLLSYAANERDLFRRAAVYVDKILKGAKPADLPVEQPTKFELVINLKTAKQLGLTIPPEVLRWADEVIK